MSRLAVRVRSSALFFTCKSCKKMKASVFGSGRVGGFVSSTSAVDYPKASSSALACYKLLQGTAGSVGESYGIDCVTDVPEFGSVRHYRKSFAWVPRG